jgi:hypothetical protein
MEKGIMLKGNGQAPAQLYMEKLLNEYIIPGKFDPTLILTHRFDMTEMDKWVSQSHARVGYSADIALPSSQAVHSI